MHLFVFADSETMVGVESYSIDHARELAGGGASMLYCRPLQINGGLPGIVFQATITLASSEVTLDSFGINRDGVAEALGL